VLAAAAAAAADGDMPVVLHSLRYQSSCRTLARLGSNCKHMRMIKGYKTLEKNPAQKIKQRT
jgi:hypothetical protein